MRTKHEMQRLLQKTRTKKCWELGLAAMMAREEIPEVALHSPDLLCQLSYVYICAAHQGSRYDAYMALACEALRLARQLAKGSEKREVLRSVGYMYYCEYVLYGPIGKKGFPCHRQSKPVLLAKARSCYEALLTEERPIYDLYHYGYLLYKSAVDFYLPLTGGQRHEQLKEAYALFQEIVERWESLDDREKKQQKAIYQKACYTLCRCGLQLLNSHAWLKREFYLLFRVRINDADKAERQCRFRQILHCLQTICEIGGLPLNVTDLAAAARISQPPFQHAGDVYYMMGKLFECAYEQGLYSWPEEALARAETYYRYACEIDMERRRQKLPISGYTHMYASLFKVYYYGHKEDAFLAAWKRYHQQVCFSEDLKILFTVRWYICKRDYDKAKNVLQRYIEAGHYQPVLTEKKTVIFLDMIQTIKRHSLRGLQGTYKPHQRLYFRRLLQNANTVQESKK